MSSVSIQRIDSAEKAPSLFEAMDALFSDIEKRAFDLFQERGSMFGSAADDWLRAERELVWSPQSELMEREKDFLLTIAIPGVEARDIQISALPDSIVVRAENKRQEEKTEGTVHFSELSERRLFRRFALPANIDVDQVRANLEDGVLKIIAAKAAEAPRKKVAAAAG